MSGAPFPTTVKPKSAPFMGFSRTERTARKWGKRCHGLTEDEGCRRWIEAGDRYLDVKAGKLACTLCADCAALTSQVSA